MRSRPEDLAGGKRGDFKEQCNKKNLPGFLFPALFNPGHDRIEILVQPLLSLFRIIPAPVGITLDEPDCIGGPEVFHQHKGTP